MVVRYIKFRIDDDMNVTPGAAQYGGIQGEHNATEVLFIFGADSKLSAPELTIHVEALTSVGGYDKTDTLTPEAYSDEDGCMSVQFLIPLAWTQYGAVTTLRLVAEQDGTVAYTAEGRVRFDERQTAMEKVDGLLRTTIGEAVAVCESIKALDPVKAAADANEAADNANKAAEDANKAREEIVEGGYLESLKELNRGDKFRVWVGSEEEYNALPEGERPFNTMFILTDNDDTDYVIEQGSATTKTFKLASETGTGNVGGANVLWTYRKWKSGLFECWGSYARAETYRTAGKIYFSCIGVQLPLESATMPVGFGSHQWNFGNWVNVSPYYDDGFDGARVVVMSYSTQDNTIGKADVSLYVKGTWK